MEAAAESDESIEGALRPRVGGDLLLRALLAAAALIAIAAAGVAAQFDSSSRELQLRIVAGVDTGLALTGALVLAAALVLALRESEAGSFRAPALSAALACWAAGVLPGVLFDLRTTASHPPQGTDVHGVLTWTAMAVLLVARWHRTGVGWAPPWLLGMATGAMISLLGPGLEQVVPTSSTARLLATGAVLAAVVVAVEAVARRIGTPASLVWRLGAAVALLGAGDMARLIDRGVGFVVGGAVLSVTGGALAWLVALRVHRVGSAIDRRRIADQSRRAQRAEATDRETRERLHEVSASVAGLAHASRLILKEGALDEVARRRLARLMDGELARVDRLAGGRRSGSGSCRPDLVLDLLATALALQGQHVEHCSCDVEVAVDEDVLFEILHILLMNGIRHAGGRGLRIRCAVRGSSLDVRVEDDGPGVPTVLRSQIFDWGTVGPGSPGQGIGLALARRLAREAGGRLELTDAEEGAGTAFLLVVPLLLVPSGSEAVDLSDRADELDELDV